MKLFCPREMRFNLLYEEVELCYSVLLKPFLLMLLKNKIMKKYFFKIRCAAIILIAAGYGWAGGHYIPAHSSIQAYIFQLIIMLAILITGIRSLSTSENEKRPINWSVTGLGIFS